MAKVHITHAMNNFYYWYLYDRNQSRKDYFKYSNIKASTMDLPIGKYLIKANDVAGNWICVKNFDVDKDDSEVCIILENNTN